MITSAANSKGDYVGIAGNSTGVPSLAVPYNYVSGVTLSNTTIYPNTNLIAMGLRGGTFTYTWGTWTTADSLTLIAIPEPSTWALLGVGVVALGVVTLRRCQAATV